MASLIDLAVVKGILLSKLLIQDLNPPTIDHIFHARAFFAGGSFLQRFSGWRLVNPSLEELAQEA
jgi:hypothetical protein